MLIVLALLVGTAGVVQFGTRDRQRPEHASEPPGEARGHAEEARSERTEEAYADEALRFRRMQLADEHGHVDAQGFVLAARQADRVQRRSAGRALVAGIERGTWTRLGPGNVGGRLRSLVVDPADPQTLWAGSASGGIWKSTDGGGSWRPLDDFMANLRVGTLVVDPQDPDVLYAGTGEVDASVPFEGIDGAGVFRTADGGRTWTQLASTTSADFRFVNRLAMAPGAPQTLLAATGSGIWRTTDGGATGWSRVSTGRALDVDYDPTSASRAIAGGEGEAWWSSDGGASWTAASGLPSGAGRVELAYARSDPTKVYASVNADQGDLFRSTDGGRSYSLVNSGARYLGEQGDYANALWVDPTDPTRVVVGGIDLWRSTNGGAGLTRISDWSAEQAFGNSVHADQHVIAEDPRYDGAQNRRVYFGTDGGVYTGDVAGVSRTSGWSNLNHGFGVTQFYSGAGNATTGRIIGGTQDNGTPSFGGNPDAWSSIFGGDGGRVAADPLHPDTFYGEYVFLRIFRSDNGATSLGGSAYVNGGNLQADANGLCTKSAPYRLGDSCGDGDANFIAPFVLDPNQPDRLLAGGRSLWRSDDARAPVTASTGPHWKAIKPSTGSMISAIAVTPGNSDVVYVGHNDGEIYKSTNATAASPAWSRVDVPAMPGRMTLTLTVDPRDPLTVYAGFGGLSADTGANLWRSTDGGATWAPRAGSGDTALPAAPVRTLAIHPGNSSFLYAGTEVGVFASADGGATWGAPQDGPANVSVDELFWMDTQLVAATHGRGMFRTDVAAVRPANDAFGAAQPLAGTDVTRPADTNAGATKQGTQEPDHAGDPGGASVWYDWTAPASGPVTVDTDGSDFDTLLAVYHGSDLAHLTLDAADDDHAGAHGPSAVAFDAVAGRTYHIAVDGARASGGVDAATGTIHLHLVMPQSAPPPGDAPPGGGDGGGGGGTPPGGSTPPGPARPGTVTGQVTKPAARCVVPRLKGRTLASAQRALRSAHCAVRRVRRASSRTVAKGRVITQSPKAGARLAAGAKVTLTVSRGRPRR